MKSRSIGPLRNEAKRLCAAWASRDRAFQLQIGWSHSYDKLLSATYDRTTSESAILDTASLKGRVILSARAGAGKTRLLRRLYELALSKGWLPVLIDLKQWSGKDYDGWREWTREGLEYGTEYLFRKFSSLDLGVLELDALTPNIVKIVFVDGLNEIASKTGAEVLSVADELASSQMNTSVVVADRLIRRELPNATRWSIAGVLPLSEEEVRKHLPKKTQLQIGDIHTSPFFLDAQLKHGGGYSGRANMLEGLLLTNPDLNPNERLSEQDLNRIGKASFCAYLTFSSRSFPSAFFEDIVGNEISRRLTKASILASSGDNSYFVHHILHDYFASRYFSKLDDSEWSRENFKALSFDASSFDALELTFEQLNAERGETFLRGLYDWNLYSAGFALAELSEEYVEPVGKEMRAVIYAMLAEKRFDSILATSERASDALRIVQLNDVEPFRQARSLSDVYVAIRSVRGDAEWFNEWREIFLRPETKIFDINLMEHLTEKDSIRGWTVSNVIRRYPKLDRAAVLERLDGVLKASNDSTVRWRVAHVLGAIPDERAAGMLLALLDDDAEMDVRYGAIRSLVEVALSANEDLREKLAAAIQERASDIAGEKRIARELRACLIVDKKKAPKGWMTFVRKCVRSQFDATETIADKDAWRSCLYNAEDLYAGKIAEDAA